MDYEVKDSFNNLPSKKAPEVSTPPILIPDDPGTEPAPSKKTFKIVIVVIILLLLLGGVVLASRVWDPVWNPFRPNPEKVMARVADKMNQVESLTMEMTVSITGDDNRISFIFNSQTGGDLDSYKSKGNFEVDLEIEGLGMSLSGEYIETDKESFIKINKLPSILSIMLGMDFSALESTWIKLEKQSNNLDEKMIEKIFESREGELFIVKKELPNEKIGKIKVYHYVLGLNEDVVGSLIKDSFNDVSTSPLLSFPSRDIPEEGLNELAKNLSNFEVDAWIGIKDNLLYRIKVNDSAVDSLGEEIFLDFEIQFSDFNEPIDIQIPKNYKGMEEVMQSMLGMGIFGNTSNLLLDDMRNDIRRSTNKLIPIFNSR